MNWASFYNTSNTTADKVAAENEDKQVEALAACWKTCYADACMRGIQPKDVRCMVGSEVPKRAWLDSMSTSTHRLVTLYTPASYDSHLQEDVDSVCWLRLQRSGWRGWVDRWHDASQ